MKRVKRGVPDWIAVHVRAVMDRSGMSIYRLSAETGVGYSELSRWLSGARSMRVAYLAKVLNVLGIDLTQRRRERGNK